MTFRYANNTVNTSADAKGALYNGGSLKVYTGTQPATADTTASGTLIATITLNNPAFLAVAALGVINLDVSGLTATTVAGGTIGWGRFLKSDGTTTIGDVSIATSGGDLTIDVAVVLLGDTVKVTSHSITDPKE